MKEKITKWISVKEKLPTKKVICGIVAKLNNCEPIISYSQYDLENGFAIETPKDMWKVTHYFEYPEFRTEIKE